MNLRRRSLDGRILAVAIATGVLVAIAIPLHTDLNSYICSSTQTAAECNTMIQAQLASLAIGDLWKRVGLGIGCALAVVVVWWGRRRGRLGGGETASFYCH